MRLPFIQVDQDAIVRAQTMARLLKIPAAQGVGLATQLFAWALEMAPDGDFSGQIADNSPAEVVAAGVGWEGQPGDLYAALVRVGFVEVSTRDEDGFDRVRGLKRYAKAFENAETRTERAKAAAEKRWGRKPDARAMLDACSSNAQASPKHRSSNADAMLGDAKTQTQTQTQKESIATIHVPDEPAPHLKFFAWAQEERTKRLSVMPQDPEPGLEPWFKRALDKTKDESKLRVAWLGYLSDPNPWAREMRPKCPWVAFVKSDKWTGYLTAATKPRTMRPIRAGETEAEYEAALEAFRSEGVPRGR